MAFLQNTASGKSILVLNAGSSGSKISLFQIDNQTVEKKSLLKTPMPLVKAELHFPKTAEGQGPFQIAALHDWQEEFTKKISAWCKSTLFVPGISVDAIGHRIVHGGTKYSASTIVDDDVKEDIKECSKLAPLHNQVALTQIEAMEKIFPQTKQIVVFDTAFHRSLPESVNVYPVPYSWHEKYGIQRFGFHGINYQYCTRAAAEFLGKDSSALSLIICHLGAGCSLAAVENGKSVNTTMGFTPMEGLMMATRCGSIDPGILLYLLQNKIMSVEEMDKELNENSGLLGVSQISSDMKSINEEMNSGNKFAKLAFDMFIERLRASICAMRASLQKLDALIFTAGIGEHSALVRQRACNGLDFLGLELNEQSNQNFNAAKTTEPATHNIASSKSKTAILVIPAREDWEIAQQCAELL